MRSMKQAEAFQGQARLGSVAAGNFALRTTAGSSRVTAILE